MPLLRQVEQPAGGADDDLDALLEGLDLRLVRAAAVDAEHADAAQRAGASRSLVTCTQSSRVGTTTSACGLAGVLEGRPLGVLRADDALAAAGCRSRGSCRCRSWPGR